MHSTLNFGSQYIGDNLADSLNAQEREKLLSDLQKYELESFCGNLNAKLLQKGLSQEQGELSDIMRHQDEFQQGNGDDSDYEPIKKMGVHNNFSPL